MPVNDLCACFFPKGFDKKPVRSNVVFFYHCPYFSDRLFDQSLFASCAQCRRCNSLLSMSLCHSDSKDIFIFRQLLVTLHTHIATRFIIKTDNIERIVFMNLSVKPSKMRFPRNFFTMERYASYARIIDKSENEGDVVIPHATQGQALSLSLSLSLSWLLL